MLSYSGFYLHKYRLVLVADENIALPEFKGSALRGAFGHTLKRLACTKGGMACPHCTERNACAYAVLFETSPPPGFPDARKYSSFPRPYLINPPLSRQTRYCRGEELIFELVLIGQTVRYLHHVLACFHEIGAQGLRSGKGRFSIKTVESVTADGSTSPVIYGDQLLGVGQPIGMEPGDCLGGNGAVLLHFLTPARFDINGKLRDIPPPFTQLVEGVSRRVSLLNSLYCGGDTFDEALAPEERVLADSVSLVDSATQWLDLERYSSRQQTSLKQGGVTGSAIYHGPVGSFLPLLKIVQFINVGKSTTIGLGRVIVSFV